MELYCILYKTLSLLRILLSSLYSTCFFFFFIYFRLFNNDAFLYESRISLSFFNFFAPSFERLYTHKSLKKRLIFIPRQIFIVSWNDSDFSFSFYRKKTFKSSRFANRSASRFSRSFFFSFSIVYRFRAPFCTFVAFQFQRKNSRESFSFFLQMEFSS